MADIKKQGMRKKKPGRYIVIVILLALVGLGMMQLGASTFKIIRLLRMQHKEEQALIEANRTKEELLAERERLLNDSAYIEEIARREYGMIREGEEIFHITLPDTIRNGGE